METHESAGVPARMQRQIRVEEYHRMISAGIFQEDEQLELLSGLIVTRTPQGVPHALIIERLTEFLFRSRGQGDRVRVQLPLTLGDDSEPEPDLAVVTGATSVSDEGHPTSAVLVIEAAGESLAYDRTVKGALYARAGISEYWVINVPEQCIEVYRDPDSGLGHYRSAATFRRGEQATSTVLPGLLVPVDALFA